jgi:hypothetical protein
MISTPQYISTPRSRHYNNQLCVTELNDYSAIVYLKIGNLFLREMTS